MVGLDPYGAFAERVATAGTSAGPLRGIALAVKDNIEVEDRVFTAGHPLFAGRRGRRTAPVVARLLTAGAGLVGMTRTDAGGFGVTGVGVRNPLDATRIAGGSSSGAGAAVAGGLADLALGTDTAGSVRIPAACVGAIGFKASDEALDRSGVWPLARSFDAVGFVAGTWAPLQAALRFLVPASAADRERRPGPRTFVVDAAGDSRFGGRTRTMFAALQRHLVARGHRLSAIELPDRHRAIRAFSLLVLAEAKTFYDSVPGVDRDRLGAAARSALALADARAKPAEVAAARAVVDAFSRCVLEAIGDADAFLAPTLPVDVPRVGDRSARLEERTVDVLHALIAETALANICGAPAITLPMPDVEGDGLPFSFTLVGRPMSDLRLVDMAAELGDGLKDGTPMAIGA